MEIAKCEFCKAYVTNFEVHNCVKFGNQHRQSSATLPQCSSGNLAEYIELITREEMEYETRWPSLSPSNSSTQQSFFPGMHQHTYHEETAATEMSSQYVVPNRNIFNPDDSDFHFPDRQSAEKNESKSIYAQQISEPSNILRSPNLHISDASNPERPAITPMSLADKSFLPGFQQTFGRRNAVMNQMSQHNNAVSQTECPGIFRRNEVSSNFSSAYHNFGEREHILMNETAQYSGPALEIPLCNIENAQYRTRNPIHSTNTNEQIETFPFTILTCDEPLANLPLCTNMLCCDREGNILNISETEYPYSITDTISLPSTSNISLENQEYLVNNLDISCYPSRAIQTQQHNFGVGIISNSELRTLEYSSLFNCSSESQNLCNISNTTIPNESNSTHKKHYKDEIMSKNVNSSKESDTASENKRKQLSKCSEERSDLPERSPTVARTYKCRFCDKAYANKSSLYRHARMHTGVGLHSCTECRKRFVNPGILRDHFRTHTGEKPFKCTECNKCFTCEAGLNRHIRTHTGEKPYSCGECGKCFSTNGDLRVHFRTHSGEKPYLCRECGKGFACSSNLRVHIRTHAGEKPYACNKCSKRYSQNVNLIRHMHKHADEERRKCDSCGAEFSSEDSPAAHKCRENK